MVMRKKPKLNLNETQKIQVHSTIIFCKRKKKSESKAMNMDKN